MKGFSFERHSQGYSLEEGLKAFTAEPAASIGGVSLGLAQLSEASKLYQGHRSFRLRMYREQYGSIPVFISKKRTPRQQKLSEFKGGDLNKYTARSYAIQNGNEIFGGKCTIADFFQDCVQSNRFHCQSD
uniref:Uncharacterized protein n=1 Tax=Ascaris lumbricoides TaxID=6252 RepID=A0A0M3IQ95_ASCLU